MRHRLTSTSSVCGLSDRRLTPVSRSRPFDPISVEHHTRQRRVRRPSPGGMRPAAWRVTWTIFLAGFVDGEPPVAASSASAVCWPAGITPIRCGCPGQSLRAHSSSLGCWDPLIRGAQADFILIGLAGYEMVIGLTEEDPRAFCLKPPYRNVTPRSETASTSPPRCTAVRTLLRPKPKPKVWEGEPTRAAKPLFGWREVCRRQEHRLDAGNQSTAALRLIPHRRPVGVTAELLP